MSLLKLVSRPCPCCGFDVATVSPVADGYRARCDSERGGCGAEAATGASPELALAAWNDKAFGPCPMRGAA